MITISAFIPQSFPPRWAVLHPRQSPRQAPQETPAAVLRTTPSIPPCCPADPACTPRREAFRQTVRLATNLYDVKTEKLIWSGKSETLRPDSVNQIIDDVIKVVIKDLQKNKLLPLKR